MLKGDITSFADDEEEKDCNDEEEGEDCNNDEEDKEGKSELKSETQKPSW